jgi:hypothetical protein
MRLWLSIVVVAGLLLLGVVWFVRDVWRAVGWRWQRGQVTLLALPDGRRRVVGWSPAVKGTGLAGVALAVLFAWLWVAYQSGYHQGARDALEAVLR